MSPALLIPVFVVGFALGVLAGYLTQRFGLLEALAGWLSKVLGRDVRLCI
jgi:hypothetical protein